jgi:hypothetical protein
MVEIISKSIITPTNNTQGFQPQLYPQPGMYGQQENRGNFNHVSSNNYDHDHTGAELVNV